MVTFTSKTTASADTNDTVDTLAVLRAVQEIRNTWDSDERNRRSLVATQRTQHLFNLMFGASCEGSVKHDQKTSKIA